MPKIDQNNTRIFYTGELTKADQNNDRIFRNVFFMEKNMFLNPSQKITPEMILDALDKNSTSDPVFKYKEKYSGHRIGFHEAIIFTKYGKIVVSDYSHGCFSPELGMCHGFSCVKTLKTGEKYHKDILLINSFFKGEAYYDIIRCFERRDGIIKDAGLISSLQYKKEHGCKIIGMPKQERYCLIEFNGRQIRVLKTFRKLPAHYVDWEEIINKSKEKVSPCPHLLKALNVLLPKKGNKNDY